MSKPKFYITTAIPYANGAPHIGHAYERIATDAIARFKRLDGYDVLFVTGMDEHGQKMQQTAAREGITPLQLADRTAAQFEKMGEELNARADDILRTTEERHKTSVQEVWRRMAANGDVYLSKYSGWYSVRDEAYYAEDETEVRENKRFALKTGTPVEWVEEESYFFRLSAYADKLLELYEKRPDFVTPEHYRNEIVAFVKRGLNDLSISRTTFDWGIPVPDDPKHVMYVWVDALTNYLSATGFPDGASPRAGFWPASAHVIGKDITRFHAIYWPAFLLSAGLPVPEQIVVHGFLFSRGEKMSKSVGNVVSPSDLVKAYGVDQTRYFFLREVPFGQDGNYSHEAIVARINADLANDLGNLAQRSLSMIAKNCGGVVPDCGPLSEADREILAMADGIHAEARAAHETHSINKALDAIWRVVAEANRYFAAQEPWALKKTDPSRMATVLYVTADVLRIVGVMCQPYIPSSAATLLQLLGYENQPKSFSELGTRLVPGTPLPAPQPIFPRYVEEEAKA
jgi:methionyl-tRNA synthetase